MKLQVLAVHSGIELGRISLVREATPINKRDLMNVAGSGAALALSLGLENRKDGYCILSMQTDVDELQLQGKGSDIFSMAMSLFREGDLDEEVTIDVFEKLVSKSLRAV